MFDSAEGNIFIHPGFGKSGTTTIQDSIFGNHDEILSMGRPYSDLNAKIRKEISKIEGIDYNSERVALLVDAVINKLEAPRHKCVVWSDETLLSNAYMRSTVVKRLSSLFKDANIIFTIRNQFKALESFYSNHGRVLKRVPEPFGGRHVSLLSFLSYAFEHKETTYVGLIDYDATIKMYEEIFGKDRVHVFLFEEFVNDKKGFSERLSRMLSINEEQTYALLANKWSNNRDSGRRLAYKRLREKFLPGVSLKSMVPFGNLFYQWFRNYLSRGKRVRVEIPRDWQERLTDLYKGGNLHLMEMRALPLDKYGYPL